MRVRKQYDAKGFRVFGRGLLDVILFWFCARVRPGCLDQQRHNGACRGGGSLSLFQEVPVGMSLRPAVCWVGCAVTTITCCAVPIVRQSKGGRLMPRSGARRGQWGRWRCLPRQGWTHAMTRWERQGTLESMAPGHLRQMVSSGCGSFMRIRQRPKRCVLNSPTKSGSALLFWGSAACPPNLVWLAAIPRLQR